MVRTLGIQAAGRIDKLCRFCLDYYAAETPFFFLSEHSTTSAELSRTLASDAYSVFINSDTLNILQYSYVMYMHPSTK
jgi:hypothetical protein